MGEDNQLKQILLRGRRESYQKTEFDGEDLKIQEPCFFPKKQGSCRWIMTELVPDSAPYLRRINRLIGVELLGFVEQDVSCFRVCGIGDAAIIDWADGSALRFVKVAHALGAAVVRNNINIVANSLTIADVVALSLCIAASFKDRLVRTFG